MYMILDCGNMENEKSAPEVTWLSQATNIKTPQTHVSTQTVSPSVQELFYAFEAHPG